MDILTVQDLLNILKKEKLPLSTKIILSSDEEGNNYGECFTYGTIKGGVVLYPHGYHDSPSEITEKSIYGGR